MYFIEAIICMYFLGSGWRTWEEPRSLRKILPNASNFQVQNSDSPWFSINMLSCFDECFLPLSRFFTPILTLDMMSNDIVTNVRMTKIKFATLKFLEFLFSLSLFLPFQFPQRIWIYCWEEYVHSKNEPWNHHFSIWNVNR